MERPNTADVVYPTDTTVNTPKGDLAKQTKRAGGPILDPLVQMKWGLTLLGEEKAAQYLNWMRRRLHSYNE